MSSQQSNIQISNKPCCQAIIKYGQKKGQICGASVKSGQFCYRHHSKTNTLPDKPWIDYSNYSNYSGEMTFIEPVMLSFGVFKY